MHRLLDQEEGETQSALGLAEMRRRDAIRDVLAADPRWPPCTRNMSSARQRVADLRQILAEVSDGLPRYWDIRPAPPPGRGVEMPWRAAVEALTTDPIRCYRVLPQQICRHLRHEQPPSHFQRRWGQVVSDLGFFMGPNNRESRRRRFLAARPAFLETRPT